MESFKNSFQTDFPEGQEVDVESFKKFLQAEVERRAKEPQAPLGFGMDIFGQKDEKEL